MEQETIEKNKQRKQPNLRKVAVWTFVVSITSMLVLYMYSYKFPIPLEKIGEPPAKIVKHIENVYCDGSFLWVTDYIDDTKIAYKEDFKGELISVKKSHHIPNISLFYKDSGIFFIKTLEPSIPSKKLYTRYKVASKFPVDGNEFVNVGIIKITDEKTYKYSYNIKYYIFNRTTATLNIYNENGKQIGSDKKSPKTKFFPIDSRNGFPFYEITPDKSFGNYANNEPQNIIHVYSNDFFIFENLNFSSNSTYYPRKVIYNGKNFLILTYFDEYDKEIEVKGKYKELYNNFPFFIGEDGLYILEKKTETIGFNKEQYFYNLYKIFSSKYRRDSVISIPDTDHGDLILKEQFKDYCLIRNIYWDNNHHLALRTSDLQIKQQTYIVPGTLLDFNKINGWEIFTTNKGEYTYAGKRGNKYEYNKYPFTHKYPFEYLFGGKNFFINNIAKYFNVGLLQISILMAFILGITFIFVYAFKQK